MRPRALRSKHVIFTAVRPPTHLLRILIERQLVTRPLAKRRWAGPGERQITAAALLKCRHLAERVFHRLGEQTPPAPELCFRPMMRISLRSPIRRAKLGAVWSTV